MQKGGGSTTYLSVHTADLISLQGPVQVSKFRLEPGVGRQTLVRAVSEFHFNSPTFLSQLSRSDTQFLQIFCVEMVRLAACLGDSGAVEALIRLGLGREDRVLVFRCDFATPSTPPVRMVSFRGAPNSLNRSELRVRALIQPHLSPNFEQFRSRPRRPNVEKHFAKL